MSQLRKRMRTNQPRNLMVTLNQRMKQRKSKAFRERMMRMMMRALTIGKV
jgi:hypothetical protein